MVPIVPPGLDQGQQDSNSGRSHSRGSGHTRRIDHRLFKTEVVRRHGPFKTISEVEYALMEWCDWYNNARLHSRLGYLTPAEYEADYYAQLSPRRPALA
nr:IS3 family transposase [Nocardia cyriacigeorgica]